ncbi:MAG: glycosyltransferase family 4 protein [Ruminococcaceae bacterium]|nr:glycosyltransferase family 4 protein [Oscillospiraceae bacterium]
MKILKLSSYYFPEKISSSHLSQDLEDAYINAGFTIENYCPTPTRNITKEVREQYKKIKYEVLKDGKIIVHRFSMFREGKNPILRAIRYIFVNLMQYREGSRAEDISVIMAGSTPPTQGVLCANVAKKLSKRYGRKVPFVYNLQDVFPDSLVTTGLAKKDSLLWKIGRKIENYTYQNADKIIVISESMKRNIMEKGVPENKIVVVSNWIDTEATKPVPKEDNRLFEEFGISRDKFKVVYAGNFGKAQGAAVVLEAAEKLKDNTDIQFVVFGGGAEFAKAKERAARLDNVIAHSLLSQERVPEVYSVGDVAVITCKKGVGNSGMPSKTWSIMACNTPIIAAFDTDSELANVIEQANAGITIAPENVEALVEAILEMKDGNRSRFVGGRDYTVQNASKEICTAKYVETVMAAMGKEEDTAAES